MKRLYKFIQERISTSSTIDVIVALILNLIIGSITAEIISRPINSYIQAAFCLLTLFMSIVTLKMIFTRVMDYIHEINN